MKTVRTRFAPSPTGKLHVGNVRTALFAYLYARHTGGKFVLRIEDTDLERSEAVYTDKLMEDMRWLGLEWDEGPQKGGPAGSYLQSERGEIYKQYAEKLIEEGRAYYCYCSPDEVEAEKKQAEAEGKPPHYSGRCKHLTEKQKREFEAQGRKPVIRFVAYNEDFAFVDRVKGPIAFPKGMVGDFVIMRANGVPVYNYAVVIDDALMEITHVLRADEHLSNTVRQLMIYRALGFEVPEFAHMALVLGPDRQKLSKRHGATSVDEFKNLGYHPDALVNYLALLGWSSPDGREILSRDDLEKLFDLDRLSPSPAIFDPVKLNWLAKHYIINESPEKVVEMARPYLNETGLVTEADWNNPERRELLKNVVMLTRGYCPYMSEIKSHVSYLLTDDFAIEPDSSAFLAKPESKTVIERFIALAEADSRPISEAVFGEYTQAIQKDTGLKGKNLYMPLRAAVTGRGQGPETHSIIPLIGKERTLLRLKRALSI